MFFINHKNNKIEDLFVKNEGIIDVRRRFFSFIFCVSFNCFSSKI